MRLSEKPVLHGRSLRWRVFWTELGQGRKKFFRTKVSAESFLDDLRRQRAALGEHWLALSGVERVGLIEAHLRAKAGGFSVAEAVAHFEKTHSPQPDGPEWTVADLVREVLFAKRAANLRERSLANLERVLGLFAGECGALRLRMVKPANLAAFLDRPGWSPRTRLGALIDVSSAFAWAIRQGRLARNPCDAVERPRLDDRPVVLLSVADGERLMRTAERLDPEWIGPLSLALFCGLRPESEIGRLSRADIARALEVGELAVDRGKIRSRGRRTVPLRNARSWLERWLPLECELRLPNAKRRWEALRGAAGWGSDNPWPQDAARHTFASAVFVLEGEKIAAREAGHSAEIAVRHYRGRLTEGEAGAWFQIQPAPGADYLATARAREAAAANRRRLTPEQMGELARRRWGSPAE